MQGKKPQISRTKLEQVLALKEKQIAEIYEALHGIYQMHNGLTLKVVAMEKILKEKSQMTDEELKEAVETIAKQQQEKMQNGG